MAESLAETYSWVRVCFFGCMGTRSAVFGRRKPTVIVLDDDTSVCRGLKMHLEILGYKVLVFHRANRLLTSAIPTGADVCLLADVFLPGMSAIELRRRLSEAGKHLPTILMSGRNDEETRRMMREAKPVASLFKPFDQAALLRAIGKAIPERSRGQP
jgi:FixJ family two-component response regulator